MIHYIIADNGASAEGTLDGTFADLQRSGNHFNGRVIWVEIQLDVDDHDHFIGRDELFAIAMARQ